MQRRVSQRGLIWILLCVYLIVLMTMAVWPREEVQQQGAPINDALEQALRPDAERKVADSAGTDGRTGTALDTAPGAAPTSGSSPPSALTEPAETAERAANGQGNEMDGKIRINSATAEELDLLPGIGPSKAQAIVDYRNAHGPFKSADDLLQVKGIGAKTLAKFRDQLLFD